MSSKAQKKNRWIDLKPFMYMKPEWTRDRG